MSDPTGSPLRISRWIFAGLIAVLVLAAALLNRSRSDDGRFARELLASYEAASAEPPSPLSELERDEASAGGVRVPVLMYHSVAPYYGGMTPMQRRLCVEPEVFESQLRWLRDSGFTVIAMSALVAALRDGAALPAKPVVITFDDGWDNQHRYALPLLEKYGATATFYVTTEYLGHRHFLTWQQVREMAVRGMTIGSHTRTHPFLTRLSAEALRRELDGSRAALDAELGKPTRDFAYPYGNYDRRVTAAVRDAGFLSARTTRSGQVQTREGLLTLKCVEARNSLRDLSDALIR